MMVFGKLLLRLTLWAPVTPQLKVKSLLLVQTGSSAPKSIAMVLRQTCQQDAIAHWQGLNERSDGVLVRLSRALDEKCNLSRFNFLSDHDADICSLVAAGGDDVLWSILDAGAATPGGSKS